MLYRISLPELPIISSYAAAEQALETASKTKTGRDREPKAYGYPLSGKSQIQHVRQRPDGAIAFRLYSTDVVAWHPDNSVEIENFGTRTTSDFADRFLPSGIVLNFPTYRRGQEGGYRTISYVRSGEARSRNWWLCCGCAVRFDQTEEGWWAPRESTLDFFRLPKVDMRGLREVAQEHHLRDFALWLSAAPEHFRAAGRVIEHEGWDLLSCLEALRERNFIAACAHLPLVAADNFGRNWRDVHSLAETNDYQYVVSMGSLRKLKLAMCEWANLIEDVEVLTLSHHEFRKAMTKARELGALGFSFGRFGPQS